MTINEPVSDATLNEIIQLSTEFLESDLATGGKGDLQPWLNEVWPEVTLKMARELQQYRAAAEPVLYCMEGDALDEENVSTSKAVVDAWVEEWNGEGRCPGEPQYRTVPLYRHAAPQVTSVPDECPSQISDQIIDMCDGFVVGDSLAQSIWNACRAALLAAPAVQAGQLSGNTEQVSQPYTLPDWLQQAHKLAELYGTSFVVFRHGEEAQCADPTKVIISFTDEGLGHHSAAPKQEAREVKK